MALEGVAQRGLARLDARRLLAEAGKQILDVRLRTQGHASRGRGGGGGRGGEGGRRLRVLHEDMSLQLGVQRLLELAALLGGLLRPPRRG